MNYMAMFDGRGNAAKPSEQRPTPRQAAPTMPKERPSAGPQARPRLPVPFPDTTVSGDPAERSDRSRPSMRDSQSEDWEPTPAEKLLGEAEKLDKAGRIITYIVVGFIGLCVLAVVISAITSK
jgi:hypothetical protein